MPGVSPADLSDAEWAIMEPLVPTVRPGGRPRAHPEWDLIDARLSVLRGGIACRRCRTTTRPGRRCPTPSESGGWTAAGSG